MVSECPRVTGASADGRSLVVCNHPMPCGEHSRDVARERQDIENIRIEVQGMWANPEMRNAVKASQNALMHRLEQRGFLLVRRP